MKNIVRVKCPAKINLTLEVLNRRDDGFHNIKSIMQTINLYDYLTIRIEESLTRKILLTGNTDEIPYNEKNLVYKAVELFLKEAKIEKISISIDIEKNIPISAGLAGGSTDAAGALWGLNYLLKIFNKQQLNKFCAQLGSDLNVCLQGGTILATSRGENTRKLEDIKSEVTIFKPKNLGISAAEAYKKYSMKNFKPQKNMTEKMLDAIESNLDIKPFLYNDLEYAVFDDYKELQKIKQIHPDAVMSGSGSTYFILDNIKHSNLSDEYIFINNLRFTPHGVSLAE